MKVVGDPAVSPGPVWPPFSPPTSDLDPDGIPVLESADGVWIVGADGRRYLDGVGALEAMAVGHGRATMAEVAFEQMRRLAFLDVFRYTSQPELDLATKLLELCGPEMKKVHFTPGGSEAVETALKLALQYHWVRGEPERRLVVTRYGAFHGVTFGAMNCDGRYHATRNDIYLGETRFGVVADGPATGAGWGAGARHAAGAAEFAAAIEKAGPSTVAAVIVDPCATASGVALAPPDDLRELRNICDRYGILLIVDEVITGFCRTGAMFAHEASGVKPDLLCFSKALSSGYMPIGACVVSSAVVDVIAHAAELRDRTFAHGHTYGGHPVACAVALENIRILEEEDLANQGARMGARLRQGLAALSHHPALTDVRGVGMLTGVELLGDGNPGGFASPANACHWLRRRLRDLGLITLTVHPGTVFLLAPPLIIKEQEVDRIVELFDAGLALLEAEMELETLA